VAFGAPDKPEVAIPRINSYYATFVPSQFPRATSAAQVHPELRRRFEAAADLLKQTGLSAILTSVKDVGGVDIRNNVNSPTLLSNHSFGWAADFDAALNPNIKKSVLPLDIIKAFTSVDLYGTESQTLRSPAAFDTMLSAAKALCSASHAFQLAMSSGLELHAAMHSAVPNMTGKTASGADVDKIFSAATSSPAKASIITSILTGMGCSRDKATNAANVLVASAALMAKAIEAEIHLAKRPELFRQTEPSLCVPLIRHKKLLFR
jgi:hypothetical protein